MHACHDGLNSWNSLSGHALGGGEAKVVNPLFVQASSENGPRTAEKTTLGCGDEQYAALSIAAKECGSAHGLNRGIAATATGCKCPVKSGKNHDDGQ